MSGYTDPDNPGFFERMRQRATGMSRAQRIVAKNPNAEVPGYLLTAEEMDACREGGDWTKVAPRACKEARETRQRLP